MKNIYEPLTDAEMLDGKTRIAMECGCGKKKLVLPGETFTCDDCQKGIDAVKNELKRVAQKSELYTQLLAKVKEFDKDDLIALLISVSERVEVAEAENKNLKNEMKNIKTPVFVGTYEECQAFMAKEQEKTIISEDENK